MLITKRLNVKCQWQYQRGAGFIEMMVSLLILGVGLLGVLSLQANGSSSNQRAIFVTEAQVLAQDMADRIRAYGGDGFGARDGKYKDIDTDGAAAIRPGCLSSGCTDDDTLAFDIYEWQLAFEDSSLPRARGMVFHHGGVGPAVSTYTVRVLWDQDRTGVTQTPDAPNPAIVNNQPCKDNATDKTQTGYFTCYDVTVSLYRN